MEKLLFWRRLSKKQIYIIVSLVIIFTACIYIAIFHDDINVNKAVNQDLNYKKSTYKEEVIYSEDDRYSLSLAKSSAWENENGYKSVYTITITNENEETMNNWNLSLEIPKEASLSQYWCGDFEVNDSTLNVNSLSYNSVLAKDNIASCGFILDSSYEVSLEDILVQFEGNSYPELLSDKEINSSEETFLFGYAE